MPAHVNTDCTTNCITRCNTGCSIESTNRVTEFHNPSYPALDNNSGTCIVKIKIYDRDVCQVRVDFTKFDIDQNTNGHCWNDTFSVYTSGDTTVDVPVLCGYNDNQHIYVHIPRDDTLNNERWVKLIFRTNNVGGYVWHATATQINCRNYIQIYPDEPPMAPAGCLQYFTTTRGRVESFNYGRQYNLNWDYSICIRRHPCADTVTYEAGENEFAVAGTPVGTVEARTGDVGCNLDYVVIAGGLPISSSLWDNTNDRYCGNRLSPTNKSKFTAPVLSRAKGPLVIRFHSSFYFLNNGPGFRILYDQNTTSCMR